MAGQNVLLCKKTETIIMQHGERNVNDLRNNYNKIKK